MQTSVFDLVGYGFPHVSDRLTASYCEAISLIMAFGVHFTDPEVVFLDPSPAVLKLPAR